MLSRSGRAKGGRVTGKEGRYTPVELAESCRTEDEVKCAVESRRQTLTRELQTCSGRGGIERMIR